MLDSTESLLKKIDGIKKGKNMENILKLIEAVIVLGGICIAIVGLLFPIMYEIKFREIYGKRGISYGMTALQIVGLLGMSSYAHNTSSDSFTEALGFTVIFFVIAMIKTYKRTKKMGLQKSVCWLSAIAQMLAPIGIILLVLLVSGTVSATEKEKKENQKKK